MPHNTSTIPERLNRALGFPLPSRISRARLLLGLLVLCSVACSFAGDRDGQPGASTNKPGSETVATTSAAKPATTGSETVASTSDTDTATANNSNTDGDTSPRSADTKTPATKPSATKPSATEGDEEPAVTSNRKKTDDDKDKIPENPFPNRFASPNLEGGSEWLNAAGPISLKDLRGKVVLLDFWTYCCINCMHVLPDLKYLEKKYDKQIVVIGVHSAKFDNEKDAENIRRAILRYEIEHPVVNDAEMTIWRKFSVRAWPSLVMIDPEGFYCGYISGEGNREILDTVVGSVIKHHKAKGTLDETPVRFDLERFKPHTAPLRFPGKITVDAVGKRLFISDSNHNRIVVTSLEGKLLDVVGSGAIGRKDGSFAEAQFDHPQGMALKDDKLYVADTENHLLRVIDLKAKTVSTVGGTGVQAGGRSPGGPALKTAINSPWDLQWVDDQLYIAMAGPHQIWRYDPAKESFMVYAGTGREDILNGPLDECALAQPSGITTDGKFLYVVDSEGSSVRKVPLAEKEDVKTIVGTSDLPQGRCLFEFGDEDGTGGDVRLQHPLGVTHHDGKLYLADSYNHKIKIIDIEKQSCTTFLGSGKPGTKLDPVQLSEPAGLAVHGEQLFICDTNNHRIVKYDLKTKAATVLAIEGLAAPRPVKSSDTTDADPAEPALVKAKLKRSAKGELTVRVALQLPAGYKVNPNVPVTYRAAQSATEAILSPSIVGDRYEAPAVGEDGTVVLQLPVVKDKSAGEFTLRVTVPYCREGKGGLCKMGTAAFKVPVTIADDGEEAVKLTATFTGPDIAPARNIPDEPVKKDD